MATPQQPPSQLEAPSKTVLSPTTHMQYQYALRRLDAFLDGAAPSDASIARYMDHLAHRGASMGTPAAVAVRSAVARPVQRPPGSHGRSVQGCHLPAPGSSLHQG